MMMSYKAAAVLKQKSRTAKTILFHFGLFLASIVIIISDTDFVTFGANNQVRNFWLSDFESIADKGWFTSKIHFLTNQIDLGIRQSETRTLKIINHTRNSGNLSQRRSSRKIL